MNGARVQLLAVLALTGVLVSGCARQVITGKDIRKDVSPALDSMALTGEQIKNRQARAYDTQLRQVHDDLASFLLEKEPSRLSPYPFP